MKEFRIHDDEKIKPGFVIPEDYFEGFSEKIMAQLPQEVKVVPLYKRMPVWIGAAAIFVVFVTIGWFFLSNKSTSGSNSSDIENYLVYSTNLSAYEIGQNLDQNDIEQLESSSLAVSDEAIEEYLLINE